MISIVISTYKPDNFRRFSENVKLNIGVVYEIIPIDNPGLMGLCEAYNKGAEKAQYPYICFCHDDILINTPNWGQLVINIFEESDNVGLLGVAGGSYKPWVPSSWFFTRDEKYAKMNVTQVYPQNNEITHCYKNPNNKPLDQVVVLDGCWFCARTSIAKEFKFDQEIFQSYHFYDIDYSLQVAQKYQNYVTLEIEMEHYSYGDFTTEWLKESFKFHKKWKKQLPYYNGNISVEEISENEFNTFCFVLARVEKHRVCVPQLLQLLYSYRFLKLVKWKKWIILNKYTWGGMYRILRIKYV